jgi:mannose/fructose-specific phosphotransferase system component IIA
MAIYLVVGWEIVHGTDANLPAVRAVRRQVAEQLAHNAAMRDPTTRAKFAEELKIITSLFGGSVENARREGNAARFAAGVAAHYRQAINRDLRTMRLTQDGFSEP